MNKCDKSENQLFDSMIRFIKNGVLLVRDLSVLLPRPTSRKPESARPERLSKTLKPDK